MKRLLVSVSVIALVPVAVMAHTSGMMTGDVRFDTMRLVEDEALGADELHERMESLMERMMAGEGLSDGEIAEMAGYMEQYPGVHSMMMGRYVGYETRGYHMDAWGDASYGWGWLGNVAATIWLLVGVLALVWLVRKVLNI